MPEPFVILDYDPKWPIAYEEEKRLILGVIGHKVRAVEHIGSTAVPGLGAKPIVDMMAGVTMPSDADECVALLQNIGYDDVTPQPDTPDWFYCLGKHLGGFGYHLHLVKFGSWQWKKHLIFRDFLRTHPGVAKEYCDLKKELAAKFGSNREGYSNAKTPFIESVISKAISQSK